MYSLNNWKFNVESLFNVVSLHDDPVQWLSSCCRSFLEHHHPCHTMHTLKNSLSNVIHIELMSLVCCKKTSFIFRQHTIGLSLLKLLTQFNALLSHFSFILQDHNFKIHGNIRLNHSHLTSLLQLHLLEFRTIRRKYRKHHTG